MRLAFRRTAAPARREMGSAEDVEQSIDVPTGTVAKLVALLSGSSGLGAVLASVLIPLVMFSCRDRPAAEHERLTRERCLQARVAALALQADSAADRRAGLRLLVALRALADADSSIRRALADSAFVPPRWESVAMLPSCDARTFGVAGGPGATAGAEAKSTGDANDAVTSPGKTPESGSRPR